MSHKIYHLMVVDRSTSMASVRDVTISGFNENLSGMRGDNLAVGVSQVVSLVTFSNDVTFDIWKKELPEIPDFNTENYRPQGSTALFDAIGESASKLLDEIREEIAKQDANVVVTIFTDGEENASKKWNHAKITSLMAELRSSRMWTFTFIGCDEKTLATAQSLGFDASNSLAYTPDAEGTREAFSKLRSSRSAYTSKISASQAFKGVDSISYATALENAQIDFFTETEKKDDKESK